jgi:prolyl oligopeptidase
VAGFTTLPPQHERVIIRLSRGGGDAAVLREFDIPSRTFVEDGFILTEAKTDVVWLDYDTLLVFTPLGEGMATQSGYARTIRLWQRDTSFEDAHVIFEIDASHIGAGAFVDRTRQIETIWFEDRKDFFNVELWSGGRAGPATQLNVPSDIMIEIHGHWLAIRRRTPWTLNGRVYPAGTVFGGRLPDDVAQAPALTPLFEPQERQAMQSFLWAENQLVISYLDNLRPVTEIFIPDQTSWTRTCLEPLMENGLAGYWRFDNEESEGNGELLVIAENPVTPSSYYLCEPAKPPFLLRRAPVHFNAESLEVTHHEARSDDGVLIPYVQVGPKKGHGGAPVYMTGYGGFEISEAPYYNATIGKLWLEQGGTSVLAHIRGGGEFGPDWHEAGRRLKKGQSHDDFAAVARDLVRRGVTTPKRIAAEGGSNGGLLIANMLVRYPEDFGALYCTIPLVDMRRYTKLLAGASWIAEYGDPDDPEEWAVIRHFSAYHLAEPGRRYPPIMIATSRADDRVHPGHARKFAAKLQALGYEAYFYEPPSGGHGYGKDASERAAFTALGLTFLKEMIGGFGDR